MCSVSAVYDPTLQICTCNNGYQLLPNGSCSLCPVGTESSSDKKSCVQCSAGKYRSSSMSSCATCVAGTESNADFSACICTLGKYLTNGTCVDCAVGTEPVADRTACTACSAGKFRPVKDFGTCQLCPLYAVCNMTAIVSCTAGFKINSARTGCEPCVLGTQSSADSQSCVSCNVGTSYRSSLLQSTCQACPSNAICSTVSSFTCNAGYEPSGDGTGCQICSEGYVKAASGNTACTQCAIGTESAVDKQSCVTCAAGKYRPSTAFNKCVSCPANGVCTASALTCNAGYKLNAAGDGCDQCAVGLQSNAGFTACISCTAGTNYRSSLAQATCQTCPSNSVCVATGFTCNAGYEPSGDGTGCQICSEGYVKAASGNTACTQCATGTESSANKQSCATCGSGKYRPSTSYNKCVPCPRFGQCSSTALTRCDNGYVINGNGDGCDQCPIGQDSSNGVTCQGCIAGYFKTDLSYPMCVKCPDGAPTCGGSLVFCQTGFTLDANIQCKRNDTYFALMQTGTSSATTVTAYVTVTQTTTSTTTSTSSVFLTATLPAQTNYATASVSVTQPFTVLTAQTVTISQWSNTANIAIQTLTISANMAPPGQPQTVTITQTSDMNSPSSQPQMQSANYITIDFIGTLPISPMIFAAIAFGIGAFLMLVVALICCRKPSSNRRKDEEFDGGMMTATAGSGMKTTSQRTFTNTR